MAGTCENWREVIEPLARRHTVIAPDLPGHGLSEGGRGDYSLGSLASGLRDLLLSLGHERATIVGQLFVSALHARKDPLSAVEALALLPEDLRLVMVGPDKGLGDTVRERSASLGLAGRVDLRGHVAKDELAALYRGALCLVFPSRYEGFGLPIVEAMASGTPVVTTAAGATTEVAGDAAVIVEPGDPCALAGGIERALADRDRLVAAGLERARLYSWAETARRTLAVYRELL